MIVDLIIIAILALSIFLGYKKGLIELSVKLCAFIIAIVATLILYRPVSDIIINTTQIDENLEQTIMQKSSEAIGGNKEEKEKTVEGTIKDGITNQIETEILPGAAREIALSVIRTVVMILLYIAIRIALKFVTILANLVAKLPILKQFNKAGGIIYGALRGILIIYAALLIISFIGQVNAENGIHKQVQNSMIGKEMYNHNLIELLIK